MLSFPRDQGNADKTTMKYLPSLEWQKFFELAYPMLVSIWEISSPKY